MAGLYQFTEPSDLLDAKMRVDGLSGRYVQLLSHLRCYCFADEVARLFIDGTWVGNTKDAEGNVIFQYSLMQYQLAFTVTYDENGTPNPFEFQGSRTAASSSPPGSPEAVAGKQVVPNPPQPPTPDWAEDPPLLKANMIIGLFGVGAPFMLVAIKKALQWRKERNEKLTRALDAQGKRMTTIAERWVEAAAAIAKASGPDKEFTTAGLQEDLDGAIESSVNTEMTKWTDAGNTIDTFNTKAAVDAARTSVRAKLQDVYREKKLQSILESFDGFNDVLNPEQAGRAANDVVSSRLAQTEMYVNTTKVSWVTDRAKRWVSSKLAEDAAGRVEAAQSSVDFAREDLVRRRARITELKTEREKYKVDHAHEAETPDYLAHVKEMDDEVADLDADAQKIAAEERNHEQAAEEAKSEHEQHEKETTDLYVYQLVSSSCTSRLCTNMTRAHSAMRWSCPVLQYDRCRMQHLTFEQC